MKPGPVQVQTRLKLPEGIREANQIPFIAFINWFISWFGWETKVDLVALIGLNRCL